MSLKESMITDVISVSPDSTVGDALILFEKHEIRTVPVIDENEGLLGIFSINLLLDALLPLSMDSDNGQFKTFKHIDINLGFLGETAHWVAHRLNLIINHPVSKHMKKDVTTATSDMPLREGVRLIVKNGSPLCIVEDGKLTGIITSQTIVKSVVAIAKEMKKDQEGG